MQTLAGSEKDAVELAVKGEPDHFGGNIVGCADVVEPTEGYASG